MSFSKYNTKRFEKDPPLKEGEIREMEIIGVGEKGDGIAKVEGFVVIVPGTKSGDKVQVKITAVRGKVSFGEVVGEGSGDDESPAEDVDEEDSEEEESEETEADSEDAEEEKSEDSKEASEDEPAAEEEETEESDEEDAESEEEEKE
ncbi:MAG: TRAM domain-containing protein [Candidatus Diapherotrites archaeon]